MKRSNLFSFAVGFAGIVLLVGILILAVWTHDIWIDRKHIVVVKSQTPVFTAPGSPLCGGMRLLFAQPGATFHVQRIRHWKNCATVDIALPDGNQGYIVLGQGEVSIVPPLP